MSDLNSAFFFRAGEIRVDLRSRTLVVRERPAKLGGRSFDVLHALVERRDRVVSKQELLDVIWPGLIVEENTLQVHVAALRKLLGPEAITTVSGRGYRFTLAPDIDNGVSHVSADGSGSAESQPLPAPSRLIGRDALIASVCALLREPGVRLVVLTGPGGSGKTRLALRVAAELAGTFHDGAFTVMLAALRDADLVASAIGIVLNVQEAGSQPAADLLIGWLRDREALLTLDNFEHLLPAAALVTRLLDACPRVKVLATSRSTLRVAGERDVAVPPLAVPSRHAAAADVPNSAAVQLLRSSALATGCKVGDSAGELEVVAEICRTLDGLPLAIELAAARLRLLTPLALLKRLGSRMHLLDGAAGEQASPKGTLRATIDWSHDLLTVPQRRLFRRLAAFAGGWELEAAESVTDLGDLPGGVLNTLAALLDQSLVQRTEDAEGEPRFAMLETVREYADEKLAASGEYARIRQRHAEHYMHLAERAEPALTSPQREPWLARLEADQQNLRAALAWLVTERRDADAGPRLASALTWMWYFSGRFAEGRSWLRQTLALEGGEQHTGARAKSLSGAARLAMFANDMPEAFAMASQSVDLWRRTTDRRGLAFALHHLGVPSLLLRGRDCAVPVMEESLGRFRDLEDPWGVALATTYKGVVLAFAPGAESEARPALTEGRARFLALGDEWGASTAPGYLAALAMREGSFELAREIAQDVLALLTRLGDTYRVSRGLHQLAEISVAQGRLSEARQHLVASLRINREQNRRGDAVQQLRLLARIERLQQRPERAVRLFAISLRADAPRAALPPDDPGLNQESLDAARSALGERRFEAEWALGAVLSVDQAVDWVLSEEGSVNVQP